MSEFYFMSLITEQDTQWLLPYMSSCSSRHLFIEETSPKRLVKVSKLEVHSTLTLFRLSNLTRHLRVHVGMQVAHSMRHRIALLAG